MKKIIYLLVFFSVLTTAVFFQFDQAQAKSLKEQIAGQYNTAAGSGGLGKASAPQRIIERVIYIILGTVGMVFFVLIFYGSYSLVTAGGDEEKVKKALAIIRPAIIGFIIILMSYGITIFIGSRVQQSVIQGVEVAK